MRCLRVLNRTAPPRNLKRGEERREERRGWGGPSHQFRSQYLEILKSPLPIAKPSYAAIKLMLLVLVRLSLQRTSSRLPQNRLDSSVSALQGGRRNFSSERQYEYLHPHYSVLTSI